MNFPNLIVSIFLLIWPHHSFDVNGFISVSSPLNHQQYCRCSGYNCLFSSLQQELNKGKFVKFIGGASNQDVVLIRNLCFVYSLAKVDCIDLSADIAVINAAMDGIIVAKSTENGKSINPVIMISVNDDEDPHFRKATFNPHECPVNCPRPCERVCPAWAIPPVSDLNKATIDGVITNRCYGCGRCVPSCPFDLITTIPHTVSTQKIIELLSSGLVEAIEIHTQPNHTNNFRKLWNNIGGVVLDNCKILSVSFPDMKNQTIPYLNTIQDIISDHPSWNHFTGVQLWQADGRPMSGDIGQGTVLASTSLAKRVLEDIRTDAGKSLQALKNSEYGCDRSQLESSIGTEESSSTRITFENKKHFIQLAGGTNNYSMQAAISQGLATIPGFGGFAFGGYARRSIGMILRELEEKNPGAKLEDHQVEFQKCLEFAENLVKSVKSNSL